MAISKESLLNNVVYKKTAVSLDKYGMAGASIVVQEMSGEALESLTASTIVDDKFDGTNFNYTLIALTAHNEEGDRLFTLEDTPAIKKLPRALIIELADEAKRLNGVGAQAEAEAIKKSDGTLSDDSGSDSALLSA